MVFRKIANTILPIQQLRARGLRRLVQQFEQGGPSAARRPRVVATARTPRVTGRSDSPGHRRGHVGRPLGAAKPGLNGRQASRCALSQVAPAIINHRPTTNGQGGRPHSEVPGSSWAIARQSRTVRYPVEGRWLRICYHICPSDRARSLRDSQHRQTRTATGKTLHFGDGGTRLLDSPGGFSRGVPRFTLGTLEARASLVRKAHTRRRNP